MAYTKNWMSSMLVALLIAGCQDHQTPAPPAFTVTTLAAGLATPIGVETDPSGRIYITESGSGKNDGRVSVVTQEGQVYPIVTGLYSERLPNGELSGTDHLLYADGLLYVLNPKGLYTINVVGFKPGDAPIPAGTLTPQDISSFVIGYTFADDTGESHAYNLSLGPDGSLYITDAAANAILRRAKTGELSVVADVPGIKNPTPVGPPFIQSVPTGITYSGGQFLISTLLGFPFPAGRAILYQMDGAGKLSVYQQTFNSLVDVEVDGSPGPLVLEHGIAGAGGFEAKTGRLLRATQTGSTVLVDGLDLPTDVEPADAHTYYVTNLGEAGNGLLLKITF